MTNQSWLTFYEKIRSILRNADIPFVTGAEIGGVRPDFLIVTRDGSKIVVDVRAWQKQPGFQKRAINQARLYQDAVGADHALIVVEDLERSRVTEGVVTTERLVYALDRLFKQETPTAAEQLLAIREEPTETVFAAMPFDGSYDDVYYVAMSHAAESIGAACTRVDQAHFTGDIVEEIKSLIAGSIAVIADLSGSNPNVLFEAGYAHGIGKPIVHICSTPLSDLPFNVGHWNTLAYEAGRTYAFRDPLSDRLKALVRERG